ncbi:MBL fold metallo-hydrolase [Enterobacteriaceae bacterium C23F]
MITLCKACGTSYEVAAGHPESCPICDDERQYVPVSGQAWIEPSVLQAGHSNKWQQLAPGLLSIETVPDFAIGQRAIVVQSAEGNILWDCISNLDDATKAIITALGGLKAIAISHPHYYSTMQDWAAAFDAPIYLHADDKKWIQRDSPHIHLWEGETLDLNSHVQLLRLGGHFAGGSVLLHKAEKGVLLSGDIIQVAPGAGSVSFMWSYPNMLPLSAQTVADIAQRLKDVHYDALYGAFEGKNIPENAADIVQQSAHKYLECVERR